MGVRRRVVGVPVRLVATYAVSAPDPMERQRAEPRSYDPVLGSLEARLTGGSRSAACTAGHERDDHREGFYVPPLACRTSRF